MSVRLLTAAAGVMLLMGLLPRLALATSELSLKADSSKKCAICHYQWVSTFFIEKRSTPIAHPGEEALETFSREMCISCHDASVRDSRSIICNDPGHRVGRVPSKQVSLPPNFPLDEGGALKCTTCHTPHAVSQQSESMVEYFLRAPNENSAFCKSCHRQKLGGLAQGNHPIDISVKVKADSIIDGGGRFGTAVANQIICETCHRAHGGVNDKFLVLPVENLQSMSVLCETCHTRNGLRPGVTSGTTRSHPVDIKPGARVHLPPRWANGEGVVFGSGGEIVCRTCHKPHQANRAHLLVSQGNAASALCVECHGTPASLYADPLFVASLPSPAEGEAGGKPAEDLPCALCHRAHDFDAVFPLTRSVPADEVLSYLFAMPHFGIHPRLFFGSVFLKEGIEPGGIMLTTEAGIPSEQGTIVCATCHDASKLGPDVSHAVTSEEGIINRGFLRTGIAEKFCKVCHGVESLVRFLYFHEKW